MKVLYVVGTNLSKNTSANISHNAYVQGLLENGFEVDIIMASSSWGENDTSLPAWKEATYFTFNSVSLIERLKTRFKTIFDKEITAYKEMATEKEIHVEESLPLNRSLKMHIRNIIKKSYEFLSTTSQLHYLDRTWLKNASHFKQTTPYDLIISNSCPEASHQLVLNLLAKKRLTETRWIQIWEDPWFFDIYAGHKEEVKKEEHRLLRAAKEVFYVSTLTLEYQKTHFPDCAYKMKHIPLPYLKFGENKPRKNSDNIQFGYFGDYYSKTRNLVPFYDALLESGAAGFINGDADLFLNSTSLVKVRGRVTLDKLSKLQDETDVLVHLCNLKGGQIPGKIYHYSATNKPILFILDGTEDEIILIKEYFEKYNRYHFCENRKEDILKMIKSFMDGKEDFGKQPVAEFAPGQVISKLLNS